MTPARNKLFPILIAAVVCTTALSSCAGDTRPRILISTDIGGTDPDDNQSMMHYLLYSNEFDCEGLVSSPSYGDGSKSEILRMIDLYEQDLPMLCTHAEGYPEPDELRSVTAQGRHGAAPLQGFSEPTEGSMQIVGAALRKDRRPLHILVWGGLDDLAQALHDAPEIAGRIRVYWIGGPNKKWSINSYVYIVENFPDLWFIENNSSYRGFIGDSKNPDKYNNGFYEHFVRGHGHLGKDFEAYLGGRPKLGDTPSLLYMMNGDPSEPAGESWGGRFEPCCRSPRAIFHRLTDERDTVCAHEVIELHISGPVLDSLEFGAPCVTFTIAGQTWDGYYAGKGDYMIRYSTYRTGTQTFSIASDIDGFPALNGAITVANIYPGNADDADWPVGRTWWTDCSAPDLYWNNCQGAQTVHMWRDTVMEDWGRRCGWLR